MTARPRRRRRPEAGVIGGAEAVPFGLLVVLVGVLLGVAAWAAVDARAVAGAAAREHVRAYADSDHAAAAQQAGWQAAQQVLVLAGVDPDRAEVALSPASEPFGPCSVVEAVVTVRVPAVRLPFLGSWGAFEVRGRHREVVDPHRAGVEGPRGSCGAPG